MRPENHMSAYDFATSCPKPYGLKWFLGNCVYMHTLRNIHWKDEKQKEKHKRPFFQGVRMRVPTGAVSGGGSWNAPVRPRDFYENQENGTFAKCGGTKKFWIFIKIWQNRTFEKFGRTFVEARVGRARAHAGVRTCARVELLGAIGPIGPLWAHWARWVQNYHSEHVAMLRDHQSRHLIVAVTMVRMYERGSREFRAHNPSHCNWNIEQGSM